MKILGLSHGHDCSYCILENGVPTIHEEWERLSRIKESATNVFEFVESRLQDYEEIKYVSHWSWRELYKDGQDDEFLKSYEKMLGIVKKNGGGYYQFGHHQCHAANAFYSSNYKKSLILTIDAGGWDYSNYDSKNVGVGELIPTSVTVWRGEDTKLHPVAIIPIDNFSIGITWHDILPSVFGLSNGTPIGNQAGTVMAMAAMGKTDKYLDKIGFSNTSQITDYEFLREKAFNNVEEQYEVARAIQLKTEKAIHSLINQFKNDEDENLCISGGVALNCVSMGKIFDWFPQFKGVYVPPVPYDAGLSIGSAQYLYHHVLDNERVRWDNNCTPYLGKTYDKEAVYQALLDKQQNIVWVDSNDDEVLNLLADKKIVSVFGGGSESGRRALGNRSILADPRTAEMKDLINDKVKHRQSFRPFAPSILREEVKNWFVHDIDSPYMNFALKFQDHAASKVPAVVHFNGTGRLQTVTEKDNRWYYNFIKKWFSKSGVPILLNTSFNDREPIVETPHDAVNCFLKTEIDYLYFSDYGVLVYKKN